LRTYGQYLLVGTVHLPCRPKNKVGSLQSRRQDSQLMEDGRCRMKSLLSFLTRLRQTVPRNHPQHEDTNKVQMEMPASVLRCHRWMT